MSSQGARLASGVATALLGGLVADRCFYAGAGERSRALQACGLVCCAAMVRLINAVSADDQPLGGAMAGTLIALVMPLLVYLIFFR